MDDPLPPRNFWERNTNRLVYWFLLLIVLVCLSGLLLPGTGGHGIASRRMASTNNLKQIGLALHNYHDTYGQFPPAYATDDKGKPLYSWRVILLPFLEEKALYEQFHLNEPWDSEHNQSLLDKIPRGYRTTMRPYSRQKVDGKTPYLGIVDVQQGRTILRPGGMRAMNHFFGDQSPHLITDGMSNTAMVIDAPARMVPWTKPEDIDPLELLALTPLADNEWQAMLVLQGDASVEAIIEQDRSRLVGYVYCDDRRVPEETQP